MSEEKRNIPIEDGNEKERKTEAGAEAAEAEAEVKAEAEEAEVKAERRETDAAGESAETDSGAEAGGDVGSESGAETGGDAEASAETETAAEEAPSPEEVESERYMRLMAEFQNFKRRAIKEKADIHAFANERIINDLLPVLDNFERALGIGIAAAGSGNEGQVSTEDAPAARTDKSEEFANYAKGMELIFEQLKTALEKAGLKEIEALGQDFNPNVHNAVMTESTDEYEDGKISKVMQKGYTLNDRVVRPSMVAVNKK